MRGRTLRVALEPLLMTLVVLVVAVGAGVGTGAAFLASSEPGEGFADLGAVVLGLLVGVFLGAVLWLLGLVWASRRLFPKGRRAGAVWFAIGLAVICVVVVSVLTQVLGQGATGVEGSVAGLVLILAVASAGFLLWERRLVRASGHVA